MAETISIVLAAATLIGLYFTFQHYRNEKAKIRLDAYPKRAAVFSCTEEFLGRVWAGGDVDVPALLAAFHHCKKEAQFLFDRKLADYLDSLYRGVDRYYYLEVKLEIEGGSMEAGAKIALQQQAFEARHWLAQQNEHLKEHFAKYLDLGKV